MSFSTFSGPIRSGTIKEGASRNTGCVILAQTKVTNFNDGAGVFAFNIPAGSVIVRAHYITTTLFDHAGQILIYSGGVVLNVHVTITDYGLHSISFILQDQSVAGKLIVGPSDTVITYDMVVNQNCTTGQGTLTVEYIQRGTGGEIAPAGSL